MKNLRLTLIASACVIALSACSWGGGGGSSHSQPKQETPKEVVKPAESKPAVKPAENKEETPTKAVPSVTENSNNTSFNSSFAQILNRTDAINLNGGVVSVQGKNVTAKEIINGNYADLDELVVGDVKVSLINANDKLNGTAANKVKAISAADVRQGEVANVSGYVGSTSEDERDSNYNAVRFGVFNADGISHLFVQGYLTPVENVEVVRADSHYPMPKRGTFSYKGNAVYGKDGQYQPLQAEVLADFSNKKVKVELKENEASSAKLTFGGEINGNVFAGSRNGVETKGGFYGSRANDVGGIFNDTNTGNNGAFGASNKRPAMDKDLKDF